MNHRSAEWLRALADLRRETRTNFLYAATMMALMATLGVDKHFTTAVNQRAAVEVVEV